MPRICRGVPAHRSLQCTDHYDAQITTMHRSLRCTDHYDAQITMMHRSLRCTDHYDVPVLYVHVQGCSNWVNHFYLKMST